MVVDQLRREEPESLSLPAVVTGKPIYHASPGHGEYIAFPGANCVEATYHDFQKWTATVAAVKENRIGIYVLKTPIMQSAANIIRHILEKNFGAAEKKKDTKKSLARNSFRPAMTRRPGNGPIREPWRGVAVAIKETESAKKILSKTGLIQKTRQNWIVQTDQLKGDWADAITGLRKAMIQSGKKK